MKRRATQSKQDVLALLNAKGTAMSHEMLEAEIDDYNRTTLYRILKRFAEDGIVHRIIGINGKQYFAVCTNCSQEHHKHDHLHFQCRKCEKVECLEEEPQINLPSGYVSENFNGLVSGLCASCS